MQWSAWAEVPNQQKQSKSKAGQYWVHLRSPRVKFWENGEFSQTISIISKSMIARKRSKKRWRAPFMPRRRFFDQIWPKVKVLALEVIKWKVIVFHGDVFLLNTLLISEIWKWHNRVRLVEPVMNMHFLTLKGQFQNLTSGQGQIMTQVGQYAYRPKRFDEPSRLAPFARLNLHPVASYWRKTDCGPMRPQMTFPWPPIISCTRIITDGVSGHDPERIGWFRLVYAKEKHFHISP